VSIVRRVNALVYVNAGWQDDWGGDLELWGSLDERAR
jgi:Rps23 Pro-64 3,4-dihydroxylase Tpa1-like proline 4-hydroxylase